MEGKEAILAENLANLYFGYAKIMDSYMIAFILYQNNEKHLKAINEICVSLILIDKIIENIIIKLPSLKEDMESITFYDINRLVNQESTHEELVKLKNIIDKIMVLLKRKKVFYYLINRSENRIIHKIDNNEKKSEITVELQDFAQNIMKQLLQIMYQELDIKDENAENEIWKIDSVIDGIVTSIDYDNYITFVKKLRLTKPILLKYRKWPLEKQEILKI